MPEDPLLVSLQRLGLGRHEAAVYAVLLEQSPAGASTIAKACRLARSSVYTALGALADKGLVGTTYENEVKQFVAEGHGALMDLLHAEQERARARVLLAEGLRNQFERKRPSPEIAPGFVYFEGREGLKRVYLAMLREAPAGAVMRIVRDEFVWSPEWAFVFEARWHDRLKKLKSEKRIETMLLVNRSPIEREHAAYYRSRRALSFRHLPAAHRVARFALYLAGDVVAVMSMEEANLVGIKMKNRNLAASFGALFDALWASSQAEPRARKKRRTTED